MGRCLDDGTRNGFLVKEVFELGFDGALELCRESCQRGHMAQGTLRRKTTVFREQRLLGQVGRHVAWQGR